MCAVRWVADGRVRLRAAGVLAALSMAGLRSIAQAADAAPFDYKSALETCRVAICVAGLSCSFEGTPPTHLILHDCTIVYKARGTVVKGDLAEGTGPDSKNSNLVLTGNVQVYMPQGHLSSDRASVQIVNDRVTTLTAQGLPAQFERFADATPPPGLSGNAQAALEHAHGHAREIIFDVDKNQLDLSGDAFVSAGCYELSAEHMVYDLTNQRVEGSPVKGFIRRDTDGCAASADKP
jgi:lipopolysaccharide transport protein LptA